MNQFSLVTSNLRRKPARACLTGISLVIAFLLFMILRALSDSFAGGVSAATVPRLVVDARFSMTDNVPMAHVHAIGAMEGVTALSQMVWFGGYYQNPKTSFATFVVDQQAYLEVFPEIETAPGVLDRFRGVRQAALVHESLIEKYGWTVGQTIPLVGDIWPKEDETWAWEFTLVGSYRLPEGSKVPRAFLVRYDYYNESVVDWVKDQAGWVVVRLADAENAVQVADAIDARFENSSDPTKSMTEDAYSQEMAGEIGDLGVIAGMILAAVFFTLVLLTANVISLGFRERVTELATLKSLGFRDRRIFALVFIEALTLCVGGAVLGICAGFAVEPIFKANLEPVLGAYQMTWLHALQALVIAALLGAAVGGVPAMRAWRLPIAQSLREMD